MENEAYMVPNPMTPCQAVVIDPDLCTGCNTCVDVCLTDVLVPNPEKGEPIVLYPDECWFCGSCILDCPVPGAIRMELPLNQKPIGWKRKETGEHFRVGMANPPPPNTRPPVG